MRTVYFVLTSANRYSISSLLGSLESAEDFEECSPHVKIIREAEIPALCSGKDALFCFSFSSYYLYINHARLTQLLRHISDSKGMSICGGPGVFSNEPSLFEIGFDYCFSGEGEFAVREICRRFIFERDPELTKIKGVLDGKSPPTIAEHIQRLDDYAPMARFFRLYRPLEITRGCRHECGYCQTPRIFGETLRHRSLADILCEIERDYVDGFRKVVFCSPDAFAYGSGGHHEYDFDAVEALLMNIRTSFRDVILNFGYFPSEIRPESINDHSLDLIRRYCSNKVIVVGAQSGSCKVLKRMNRSTDPEMVFQKVRLAREKGLKVCVDYIFGMDFETTDEVRETLREIRRLEEIGARIHTHIFMPLKGTQMQDVTVKVHPLYFDYLRKSERRGSSFGDWKKHCPMI